LKKEILRLAVPNILSNLSVPLLSSVDLMLIGHLGKSSFIGAVAVGGMIFSFLYWGFGFLRMGTTGLTAQGYGKRDFYKISSTLYRSLFSAFLIAFLIFSLQHFVKELSFYLIEASKEVEDLAEGYFEIRIFDAFAVLSLYVINGWLMGMQNAKYTMYIVLFTNFLNVVLDAFFIYFLDMDVKGVALGTVISQYAGVFLGLYFIFGKYGGKLVRISLREIFHIEEILEFAKLNSDIFVRTVSLIFAFSFFTAQSAKFGDDILAANTILMQLWTVFAYGIDGFAFAAESLVGKYLAKSKELLRRIVREIFYFGFGSALFFFAVLYLFPKEIISFFTDNQKVILTASEYMGYTIVSPLINSFCYIWDGIYIGATASRALRNSMLIAVFFIYLPTYYLTKSFLGNHSLWISMLLFMAARGALLSFMAKKEIFRG